MNTQHPLYGFLKSKKSRILYLFFVIEAVVCAILSFAAPLLIHNLANDACPLYYRLLLICAAAHILLSGVYAAGKALILSGNVHLLKSFRKIRFIRYILVVILLPIIIYIFSTDSDSLTSDDFSTAVHIYTALLSVFFLMYNAGEMRLLKALSDYPNPPKKSHNKLISYFSVISTVFGAIFAVFAFSMIGVSIILLVSQDTVFASLSEAVMVIIMITVLPFLSAKFFTCARWAKQFEQMQLGILLSSAEPKVKAVFNTNESTSIYRKED